MTALILQPDEQDLRKHVLAINQYAQGRSNAGARFTCALGSTTTTVSDVNVGSSSVIMPCAASAAAALEWASGQFFIDRITAGGFLVHHTNSATANRIFTYGVQG
jgi:hypothetical protein